MFIGKNRVQLTFDSQFFGEVFKVPENDPHLIIANKINWDELLFALRKYYSRIGTNSMPVKNLVLLLLFKHYHSASDVEIIEMLAGSLPMQKALDISFKEAQIISRKEFYFKKHKKKEIKISGYINPATLSNFRKRLGNEGMDLVMNSVNTLIKPKRQSKTIIVDTTVSPSDMLFPTDINLLEKARQITLRHLKQISLGLGFKFRTYKNTARKTFLNYIKLGKKKRLESRKVQGKMIRFLQRNLNQLKEAFAKRNESINNDVIQATLPKEILVIEKLLAQQKELWKKTPRNGSKHGISIKDRIVSIFRPHVRPMSRGKIPNPTEFGGKILLEMRNGFLRLLKVTFRNENDSEIVKEHIKDWKGLIVGGDRGIFSKENEKLAKENGVKHFLVERKGKKSLEKTSGVKRIRKIRPAIEAKIGLAKRKFGLGRNKYKRGEEGEMQWIKLALCAMNLRLFIRKAQLK